MEPVNAKQLAAEKAVTYIENGMVVGLGTGSTAYYAIKKIGERIANEGLQIKAIATSSRSQELAIELNIPITTFENIEEIDITIDGADEVDSQLNLIKGGGGALLREKIVATSSKQMIVVVDESKLVKTLGKFPLPVEVVPFAVTVVIHKLQQLGCKPVLRKKDNDIYKTDNGNYILDCSFEKIDHPAVMHKVIKEITGVVDNGLFIQCASMVIAAYNDGHIEVLK